MQQVDREGTFRAQITSYGLKEMDSGSVSVAIRAKLTEWFSDGEWHPWVDFDMEAEGDCWIIKKDGSVNEGQAKSLMQHAGWDGNVVSVVNETWQPTPCQVSVVRDDYQGKVRFKISFVNDYNRTPGALSNVTADKANDLQTRFGSQLRAIAGNIKRTAAPANGRPAAPPPAAVRNPPPDPHAIPVAGESQGEDIPF